MMKEDKERINNYQNKVKDEGMVRNYKIWAKIFYQIDKLVSQILNDYGLFGSERIFYHAYAKEVYQLKIKYKYKILERELKIREVKWLLRGLKKELLLKIKGEILKAIP